MTRRRFVYTEGGRPLPKPYEVGAEWRNQGHEGGHKSEAEVFGNLQAPDGTDISTRKRHREYMQRNGLTLTEDYREKWQKDAQERARYFTEGGGPNEKKARRESIEKAYYKLFRY